MFLNITATPSVFSVCLLGSIMMLASAAKMALSDEAVASDPVSTKIHFNRDVRPILSKHCIACHGPDEGDRQADLRLDNFEGATADLGGYAAVVPNQPEASDLLKRIITEDQELRMPPKDHADRLAKTDIEILRRWIASGGEYESHWSFISPRKSEVPSVESLVAGKIVVQNEIDNFILKRLAEDNLPQNPMADPRALVRRVSLDLTGLPPQAHELSVIVAVQGYLSEPYQANFEKVVDQLLATSAYGEHWAALWLDIARYADTVGYSGDEQRDIWPWRDWLIRALNDNKSLKDFSMEMLAGDLLVDATDDQKLATAFHRNTLNNNEGGTSDEEFRTIAIKDRVSTTMNAWMGLTFRCAECHTHKYDPISQTEYYQFLDFFNQTADADHKDDLPRLDWTDPNEIQISDEIPKEKNSEKADEKPKATVKPVRVPVLVELPSDNRRNTFVMIRGNYLSPGDKVSADFPKAFQTEQSRMDRDGLPRNRLLVAKWLFDDQNPLTARVAVNRYWARLFGIGIVETEEDFGTQGSMPSHPDLLDWLAVDFRENGWDVKKLLKRMVMSATYQQSQGVKSELLKKDPRNRLLSRGPRIRLPAEVVRDQALAVSKLLSRKLYGPPVYPPSPIKKIVNAFTGGMTWTDSQGEDRYRRSLYTFLKRSQPHPLFETFDMATRDVCSMRRLRTNTPLQSFMTLNDILFIEPARRFAEEMLAVPEGDQIAYGLENALFVSSNPDQVSILKKLYESVQIDYQKKPEEAAKMIGKTDFKEEDYPAGSKEVLELSRQAAMTVVANVILNLDGFLNN